MEGPVPVERLAAVAAAAVEEEDLATAAPSTHGSAACG